MFALDGGDVEVDNLIR
ncbi:hypothetical protein A2U01_0114525, partial [Trifolium medium]|nr:hypothetical protein [Trifolium medium]